jgi:hypothetical protein
MILALALCGGQPAGAEAVPGSFGELADLRSACRAKAWRTRQASGYDRGGGFYDSGNFLRIEPGRRYVLMEAAGPGCIDRQWFTRKGDDEAYDLLIYLDGETTPRISMDLDALCAGRCAPFASPFVGCVDKARYAYTPIGFTTCCRVVLVPTKPEAAYRYRTNSAGKSIPHVYYQITYRIFPAGTRLRPFSWELDAPERNAMAAAAALWTNAGAWPWGARDDMETLASAVHLKPGECRTLFDLAGPGVIYGLTVRAPPGARGALAMTWERAAQPAVAAPLGTFFAAPGQRPARGLWLGCAEGRYYSCFPMPFRTAAAIALRSEESERSLAVSAEVRVRREAVAAEDLLFHAAAYDHDQPPAGQDYTVLETSGTGHWVGVVMDRPGNMEGDDRFFVDGEASPSLHGTGTEDFFNFAWGFAHIAALPLHGITDQGGGAVCYRFHLPAAVPYSRSLRIAWEHGSENVHQGRYSGVAYYYRSPVSPPP